MSELLRRIEDNKRDISRLTEQIREIDAEIIVNLRGLYEIARQRCIDAGVGQDLPTL